MAAPRQARRACALPRRPEWLPFRPGRAGPGQNVRSEALNARDVLTAAPVRAVGHRSASRRRSRAAPPRRSHLRRSRRAITHPDAPVAITLPPRSSRRRSRRDHTLGRPAAIRPPRRKRRSCRARRPFADPRAKNSTSVFPVPYQWFEYVLTRATPRRFTPRGRPARAASRSPRRPQTGPRPPPARQSRRDGQSRRPRPSRRSHRR